MIVLRKYFHDFFTIIVVVESTRVALPRVYPTEYTPCIVFFLATCPMFCFGVALTIVSHDYFGVLSMICSCKCFHDFFW